MKKFLVVSAVLASLIVGGGWIHGGGAVAPACPNASPAGQDDGCASANKSAQFINAAYFTNSRQSGQAPYAATPSWNIAGVTYPVGQITSDVGLIDFKTSPPSGWSVLVPNQIYQNGSAATVSGYFLDDIGIFKSSGDLTLTNNHIRMGRNTCRSFNGTAPVNVQSSSAVVVATNNTWDTTSECMWQAELYGTSYDPGLQQQSSENITIASNVLTVNSGGTGFFAEGQFLNWSGITQQVRVSTNISPGGITNCTGSACNGTTWTVCQYISANNSGACNASVTNTGPVNSTTGPIQPTANAAIRQAATNGSPNFTARYNYINLYSTFAAPSTGGTIDVRYNYMNMTGHSSDHDNFVVSGPAPGGTATIPYYAKFNTVVWDKYSPNTGTTLFGNFVSSQTANSATGYQITYDPFDVSYNTGITNQTQYPSPNGVQTAAMWRALPQGLSVSNICIGNAGNCAGTSISGTTLTVGLAPLSGTIQVGDYIFCAGCARGPLAQPKIIALGTGTGGAGTYTLDTSMTVASSTNWNTQRYPGIVANMIGVGNYFDPTGAGAPFIIDDAMQINAQDFTSVPNINMLSGNACTPSSCP